MLKAIKVSITSTSLGLTHNSSIAFIHAIIASINCRQGTGIAGNVSSPNEIVKLNRQMKEVKRKIQALE